MNNKRKICVVTGSRAEYGLLYWLMKEIKSDDKLELQLIVTAMHLSPEFGLTYKEIEKEFFINKKIEILLSSDTPIGISKSMGLAQISFSEAYDELKPDLIVLLGDRYEIFSAAATAMIANIPIVHLHGGELTEGAFDDSMRHSITKMSHIHFTSTEDYRRRVIQLGETPERVFNVGALGIDNIKKLKLMSRREFEKSINFKLNKKNILVTFHPVTLDKFSSEEQFQKILNVIDKLKETNIIFTKANSDKNGRIINCMIDKYVAMNNQKSIAFISMGQLRYLSALQYVDCVVGNSSSGIIEAPTFKIGTINIGERQKGRISGDTIIHCKNSEVSIKKAFEKLYSDEFQSKLKNVINPYGNGGASEKIKKCIKKIKLEGIIKKKFYDIVM